MFYLDFNSFFPKINELQNAVNWNLPTNSWDILEPNIYEEDNQIVIELDMPGFDKEKIQIQREGRTMTISSAREYRTVNGTESRSFLRTLTMPSYVNLEEIDAEYKNGVLTVKAQKQAPPKKQTKQIDVK